MKKEKAHQVFKVYNYVMQEVWKLLTILLIGVGIGFFVKRKTDNKNAIVISLIIALFIGLITFFVGLFRVIKRLEKEKDNHNNDQN